MRRCLGPIAREGQFWPREDIMHDLEKALAVRGESRRMFGLRRIGKSSLLAAFESRMQRSSEVTIVSIDAQKINQFDAFLRRICEGIAGQANLMTRAANQPTLRHAAAIAAKKYLDSDLLDPKKAATFADALRLQELWSGDFDKVLRKANNLILIVDELPFMIRNMMENDHKPGDITTMLAMLRHWRNECGVRMLLSGSHGLAQIAREYKVSITDHIGDALPMSVPPLSPDDAASMIDTLARDENIANWNRDVSQAIVRAVTETWPIFLQYGFDAVANTQIRDVSAVADIVAKSNQERLNETFYTQFTTRLGRYGDDEKPARVILRTIKAGGQPISFSDVDTALDAHIDRRDDIMEALREDDFIRFDTANQTAWLASKLVPVWISARTWGK
jgi:AAA domain